MNESALVDSRTEYEWRETGTTIETASETIPLRYNPATETYLAVHDWEADESLSMTVVAAVGAVAESELTELPPLFESVDADALNDLFEPIESDSRRREAGRVTVPYSGFRLTVHANGEIRIQPQPSESEEA